LFQYYQYQRFSFSHLVPPSRASQQKNMEEQRLTPKEQLNMKTFELLAALAQKYAAKEITAEDLAQESTQYMTDDVVYWSNYIPSWEPLRPLYSERYGIGGIIERYDYEHKVEQFKEGVPTDFAISGDVAYFSQHETASFFNKEDVTWDMVTKVTFREGKIARLEMFLDFAPIEEAYGKK
jgi:ketosteroid isomerase-like protein